MVCFKPLLTTRWNRIFHSIWCFILPKCVLMLYLALSTLIFCTESLLFYAHMLFRMFSTKQNRISVCYYIFIAMHKRYYVVHRLPTRVFKGNLIRVKIELPDATEWVTNWYTNCIWRNKHRGILRDETDYFSVPT